MRIVVTIVVVGLMMTLFVGVALAKDISCTGGLCKGTNGDDELIGTVLPDVMYGRDGIDFLAGQGGKDKLYGGGKHDFLIGGTGDDKMYGGKGSDTLNSVDSEAGSGASISGADYVNCGPGSQDEAYVDPSDTVVNCETVSTSES